MPGTLYLCATPIGNLGDMTPRVVETLQTVDCRDSVREGFALKDFCLQIKRKRK